MRHPVRTLMRGRGSRSYDTRSVRRGLTVQTSMCVEALCRALIGSAGLSALKELFFGYKGFQAAFKGL